jgi:hypothetical protein
MSISSAVCSLACAVMLALGTSAAGADDVPAKSKPNDARLKGMKAAIGDIEKGVLKEKHPPYPDAPQHTEYFGKLKKDYGVAIEVVDDKTKAQRDETAGYNDVMRVEIEHRFGRGLLDKLWKEAWRGAEPKGSVEKNADGK